MHAGIGAGSTAWADLEYAATSGCDADSNAGTGGNGCNCTSSDATAQACRYASAAGTDAAAVDGVGADSREASTGIGDAAGVRATSSCYDSLSASGYQEGWLSTEDFGKSGGRRSAE
jgi:hypothetical protein